MIPDLPEIDIEFLEQGRSVRVRMAGSGWTFPHEEDRARLAQDLLDAAPDLEACRQTVRTFVDQGRLDREHALFLPEVHLVFLPSAKGARGDRDVSLDIRMPGWGFGDAPSKKEFDKALNLINSPTLHDSEAIIDQDFLDTVRDEIESLLLSFYSAGRLTPKGETVFVLPPPPPGALT